MQRGSGGRPRRRQARRSGYKWNTNTIDGEKLNFPILRAVRPSTPQVARVFCISVGLASHWSCGLPRFPGHWSLRALQEQNIGPAVLGQRSTGAREGVAWLRRQTQATPGSTISLQVEYEYD
jgi:hypothetical protein